MPRPCEDEASRSAGALPMNRPAANSARIHKPARRQKPEMTLDRLLSRYGVASRREAAALIAAGRVRVNGQVVRDPLRWIAPASANVTLDLERLKPARKLYFALSKPKGYLTSHGDPRGRKTVYGLLPPELQRKWLFPVGRLDQDTSGLLLFTNDSIFAERITNPASKVAKAYLAKINGRISAEQLGRLRAGLEIGRGERSGPAKAEVVRDNGRFCWIELEIHEGKNRQVRRMFQALGYEVLKLTRTRIGKLELGGLAPGTLRPIRPSDVV